MIMTTCFGADLTLFLGPAGAQATGNEGGKKKRMLGSNMSCHSIKSINCG